MENRPVQEFKGNMDQSSLVRHWLKPHYHARFVRFVPLSWVGQRCMRVELHGCKKADLSLEKLSGNLKNGKSRYQWTMKDNKPATDKKPRFWQEFMAPLVFPQRTVFKLKIQWLTVRLSTTNEITLIGRNLSSKRRISFVSNTRLNTSWFFCAHRPRL